MIFQDRPKFSHIIMGKLLPEPFELYGRSILKNKQNMIYFTFLVHQKQVRSTVGHKSHDPCFHEKYMETGVMTFVPHCT